MDKTKETKAKDKLREKIIAHAKTGYQSSPIEFTEEEIDAIIANDCKCSQCGESIFNLADFPIVRNGEVFCEYCNDSEFKTTCPVCEENYETEYQTDYFFITKETTRDTHLPVGLYKATKHPFFYGDCVTGFDGFYNDAIEQVNNIDIDEYKRIELAPCQIYDSVKTDLICPDCAKKYTKYENLMNVIPHYCVLHPKYDAEYRAKYSADKLHRMRQHQVNINITLRGMLEKANNPKFRKTIKTKKQ